MEGGGYNHVMGDCVSPLSIHSVSVGVWGLQCWHTAMAVRSVYDEGIFAQALQRYSLDCRGAPT